MKLKEVRISSVPVENAAHVFDKFGFQISRRQIRQDIQTGAPLNPDGTINIVRYTSWLFKRRQDA